MEASPDVDAKPLNSRTAAAGRRGSRRNSRGGRTPGRGRPARMWCTCPAAATRWASATATASRRRRPGVAFSYWHILESGWPRLPGGAVPARLCSLVFLLDYHGSTLRQLAGRPRHSRQERAAASCCLSQKAVLCAVCLGRRRYQCSGICLALLALRLPLQAIAGVPMQRSYSGGGLCCKRCETTVPAAS